LVSAKENSAKVNKTEEFYGMQYSVDKVDSKVVEVM
jgi:hypothetical protein